MLFPVTEHGGTLCPLTDKQKPPSRKSEGTLDLLLSIAKIISLIKLIRSRPCLGEVFVALGLDAGAVVPELQPSNHNPWSKLASAEGVVTLCSHPEGSSRV
eukprot:3393815-Rhodomonas_salina.1